MFQLVVTDGYVAGRVVDIDVSDRFEASEDS
jgi:hypothetical protein